MASVPDRDHLVRNVPWAKLRKDENDNVIGVTGEAFRMRDGETTLSATWLEYFKGDRWQQLCSAVQTMRSSTLLIKPKSGFAVGNVGEIKNGCLMKRQQIRIVHEPEPANPAHVAVRRYPRDNPELFELLANDAWSDFELNRNIP